MKPLSPDKQAIARIMDNVVERFLARKPHLDDGRKVIAKLRNGEVLAKTVGTGLIPRLAKLFPEMANLSKTELVRRAQPDFKRLFGKGLERMRVHPERRKYHSVLNELHVETSILRGKTTPRDLHPETGANLAIDPRTFEMLQDHGTILYHNLAGTIDAYGDLAEETRVFNGIMKTLYPEKYLDEFRLDAQHLIEQRAFEPFQSMWVKMGWVSKRDLPAIPLHYNFHIRTPKAEDVFPKMLGEARKGFAETAELAKRKDIVSLTDSIERAIPLADIKKMKPEEYVAKAIEFYTPSKIGKEKREIGALGKDIVPVLKEVQQEIDRIRTLEKGFKSLRK